MGELVIKLDKKTESYSPKVKPQIIDLAESNRIKNACDVKSGAPQMEIFYMPQSRIIGKLLRSKGLSNGPGPVLWERCLSDGSLHEIRQLPALIPNAIIGWSGDYPGDDDSYAFIIGVFTPAGTPVPDGMASYDLPATLVAKGAYCQPPKKLWEEFEALGYENNYCKEGWNGEIYFDDDPEHDTLSMINPKQNKSTWISPIKLKE